jgi:hypothetical protein
VNWQGEELSKPLANLGLAVLLPIPPVRHEPKVTDLNIAGWCCIPPLRVSHEPRNPTSNRRLIK